MQSSAIAVFAGWFLLLSPLLVSDGEATAVNTLVTISGEGMPNVGVALISTGISSLIVDYSMPTGPFDETSSAR